MVSPQLKALFVHAQLHRAPPDDTGGRLTASTVERLPAELRRLPHGDIDLTDVDGTILVPAFALDDDDLVPVDIEWDLPLCGDDTVELVPLSQLLAADEGGAA